MEFLLIIPIIAVALCFSTGGFIFMLILVALCLGPVGLLVIAPALALCWLLSQ